MNLTSFSPTSSASTTSALGKRAAGVGGGGDESGGGGGGGKGASCLSIDDSERSGKPKAKAQKPGALRCAICAYVCSLHMSRTYVVTREAKLSKCDCDETLGLRGSSVEEIMEH